MRSHKSADDEKCAQLLDAVAAAASRRAHTVAELSICLGVHPSHWYRLRRDPTALRRCQHQTLEGIAKYVDWSIGRVLLASGAVSEADLQVEVRPDTVVASALKTLKAGPFGAGLATDLDAAAPDHKRLIAELFLLVQAQSTRSFHPSR